MVVPSIARPFRRPAPAASAATRSEVLDAGCGTGGLLLRLTHDLPQLDYTGLDYDAAAVKIAEAKTGATIQCGTVNALPFPADHFDAILSADVLCHAQVDELEAMSEFLRCLRSGRSLLLNLPAYNWMKSSHDRHVHNVRRYTATSVRQLAEATGFRIAGDRLLEQSVVSSPDALPAHGRSKGTQSDVRALPGWQDRLFYATTVARAEVGSAEAFDSRSERPCGHGR